MTEGEIDAKEVTLHKLTPLIGEYVSYNDMYSKINLPNYELPYKNRPTKINKNYPDLFRNAHFENLISQMDFYYEFGKRETNGLIVYEHKIISMIERDFNT